VVFTVAFGEVDRNEQGNTGLYDSCIRISSVGRKKLVILIDIRYLPINCGQIYPYKIIVNLLKLHVN